MENNVIILECKRVKFYAQDDETMFFTWLEQIKSIVAFKGKKDVMYLTISKDIPNEELQSLVGLFRRFKINKKQLTQLITKANEDKIHYYLDCFHYNVYPVNQ